MRWILLSGIMAIVASTSGVAFAQTNFLRLDEETRNTVRNATDDKWFKKDNFVSTLLGGALAIAGGLAASWFAHRLQAKHKMQEDTDFSANVLRAIRCELEALHALY